MSIVGSAGALSAIFYHHSLTVERYMIITQEQIDAWPLVNGLKTFPAWSVFGGGCRFGESSTFGDECNFGKGSLICGHTMLDLCVRSVSSIGVFGRTLYAWNTVDGWFCQAGCRFTAEYDFIAAVREKYGENSDYERAVAFLKSLKIGH